MAHDIMSLLPYSFLRRSNSEKSKTRSLAVGLTGFGSDTGVAYSNISSPLRVLRKRINRPSFAMKIEPTYSVSTSLSDSPKELGANGDVSFLNNDTINMK
jgi:hypothetical protein